MRYFLVQMKYSDHTEWSVKRLSPSFSCYLNWGYNNRCMLNCDAKRFGQVEVYHLDWYTPTTKIHHSCNFTPIFKYIKLGNRTKQVAEPKFLIIVSDEKKKI